MRNLGQGGEGALQVILVQLVYSLPFPWAFPTPCPFLWQLLIVSFYCYYLPLLIHSGNFTFWKDCPSKAVGCGSTHPKLHSFSPFHKPQNAPCVPDPY